MGEDEYFYVFCNLYTGLIGCRFVVGLYLLLIPFRGQIIFPFDCGGFSICIFILKFPIGNKSWRMFAMKTTRKSGVIDLHQEIHIKQDSKILSKISHPFITNI
eukprot:227918_1